MTISMLDNSFLKEVHVLTASPAEAHRSHRIMAALGLSGGRLPKVDDEMLRRYYEYLAAELSLPYTAYYPEPTTFREYSEFRCSVVELLDPAKYLGDELDGIFCKVRKGKYEVNLPLAELDVPPDHPNFQLIDDYWYWFWNRRF